MAKAKHYTIHDAKMRYNNVDISVLKELEVFGISLRKAG